MPSGSPDRAKPTILVVDDDQGLLRLVTKALHREQFATASAASFQEAVDWLSQHTPDLMLLDLQLGDIGGKDLIDQLTVRGRNVPFIIITGQGDERMAVAMMKRGAIDYLIKDVDFLQFVPEVVRRALGQLERDKKLSAAEEALRRSEANLAKAQQIAHLGSYELNVASAPNDYYSDEIYRILGLDPGSAVLSRHEDFARMVHRDDHDAYRLALDGAIRNAAPFNLEYRVVRPDGAVRHVHTLGQPTLDATGRVAKFVGTLLDITDRKRAELRQKVLYTATQALAESSNLPEAAAQILKAVAETFGWDRGELWQVDAPAKTLWRVEAWPATRPSAAGPRAGRSRLSLGEDLPGRAWASREPVCGRIESETEPGGKAGDGMAAPRDAVGLPVLLGDEVLGVAVFTSRARPPADADLLEVFKVLGSQIGQFIERKRAEEALRKEHAFSSAVLDTSAALVVVLDSSGRIVRFNRACEQTTGYSHLEVAGKLVWNLLVPADEVESTKAVFDRIRAGQFPTRNENHWQGRAGGSRLVAWSHSALVDDHNEVEYIISIGIDISDRRRLEQEILQISELEQRRIGQDLHDGLCQHLAATALMSEILEQKIARKSKSDAARVAEIAKQVREGISQTRSLARGLSPVVLESQGLMSALEQLAGYTERMFRVDCDFVCDAPVLVEDHGVATHLYRIAQEGVSNAIRHGKAKRITISLRDQGDRTILRVRDNGVGLPADSSKADGMGLRIMRYRAAMIAGWLTVRREPDGGTSVTCSIQSTTGRKSDRSYDRGKETQEDKANRSDR